MPPSHAQTQQDRELELLMWCHQAVFSCCIVLFIPRAQDTANAKQSLWQDKLRLRF